MNPKPAKPPTAVLKLRFLDKDGKPESIPEGVLSWAGDLIQCKTNADGVLIPFDSDESADPPDPLVVNAAVQHGELDLKIGFPAGEIFRSTLITLKVFLSSFGGADTPAGAAARVNNLGYAALPDDPTAPLPATVSPAITAGLKRFRQVNHIRTPDDGPQKLDDVTSARLADLHDNPKSQFPS